MLESIKKFFANRKLFNSIRNGNLTLLNEAIAAGANVNNKAKTILDDGPQAEFGGYTALSMAAQLGHLEIVQALINAGANVNASNTPLTLAAFYGHSAMVEVLVREGANVN